MMSTNSLSNILFHRFVKLLCLGCVVMIYPTMNLKLYYSTQNYINKIISFALWRPQHSQLALSYFNSTDVTIVDVTTNQIQYTLKASLSAAPALGISDISWSSNGELLATAFEDKIINIWDLRGDFPKRLLNISYDGRAPALSWSPDGQRIAVAWGNDDSRRILVWDVTNGMLLKTIDDGVNQFKWVLWSPDGQYLVTNTWDGHYKLWNAQTYEPVLELPDKTGSERSSRRLATWNANGTILAGINCLGPGGSCIIWIFNIETHAFSEPFNYGYTSSLSSAALSWSPDSKFLVASDESRQTVYIWDVVSKALFVTLNKFDAPVTSTSWSSNSQQLVVSDGNVHFWSTSIAYWTTF